MRPARLLRYGLLAIVVLLLVWLVLRPTARPVDVATVARGPIAATIEAEGRTRVRDRYRLSAPIAGRMRRLDFEPGDRVQSGQVLVEIEPLPSALLDPRSRQQAQAAQQAAQARLRGAGERRAAAVAAARQARADADRLAALARQGLVPSAQAEQAHTAALRAEREADSARFDEATARSELALAAARLALDGDGDRTLALTAPVDGVVLRRFVESTTAVQPGEPLLEVGDPDALEVEVDVLSADAVRLQPDMPVSLQRWGADTPLAGHVLRVEPGGFTKVSALGVEEQRVWVIVAIDSPRETWTALGDAYRVDAVFTLDARDDALRVPASAVFEHAGAPAVFRLVDGRARLQPIRVDLDGGAWMAVTGGIDDGQQVIVHPDRALADGDRVEPR